jgi:hypothetical protein
VDGLLIGFGLSVAGIVIGAILNHYLARGRSLVDYERTLDLVAYQDERKTAQAIRDAAREFSNGLHAGTLRDYGELHNEWQDRILFPAGLIRSDDLKSRAISGLYVVWIATIVNDEFVTYALTAACGDIQRWTRAWLSREPIPPAEIPSKPELMRLTTVEGNRISIGPLNELLMKDHPDWSTSEDG